MICRHVCGNISDGFRGISRFFWEFRWVRYREKYQKPRIGNKLEKQNQKPPQKEGQSGKQKKCCKGYNNKMVQQYISYMQLLQSKEQKHIIIANTSLVYKLSTNNLTFVSGPSSFNEGSKKNKIFRKSSRVWNKAKARNIM